MLDLEKLCEIEHSFHIGSPMSRFGWTFFELMIKTSLINGIDKKFSDMIRRAKGTKQNEKLTNFLADFFASRGCQIKLKILDL